MDTNRILELITERLPVHLNPAVAKVKIEPTEKMISLESLQEQIRTTNANNLAPLYIFFNKNYGNLQEKEGFYRLRAHSIERHLLNAIYRDLAPTGDFEDDMNFSHKSNFKALLYYNGKEFKWFSPFRRKREKYFYGTIEVIDFMKLGYKILNTELGRIAIFVDREIKIEQTKLF